MEFEIDLPCCGEAENLLANEEIPKYLRKEWIGKMALWLGMTVWSASTARNANIDDSNSSSEGIIRWLKENTSFKNHCSSLGLFMNWFWDNHVKKFMKGSSDSNQDDRDA